MKKHLFLIAALALLVAGCNPPQEEIELEQNQMYINGTVYDIIPGAWANSAMWGFDAQVENNQQIYMRMDVRTGLDRTIDLSAPSAVENFDFDIFAGEYGILFYTHEGDCGGDICGTPYEQQSIFESGEITFSQADQGGVRIILDGVLLNGDILKVNYFIADSEIDYI